MPKIKLSLRKIPGVSSDINNIVELLSKGGSVIYPSDTVWGLGCDASNEEAVKNIFKLKKRKENTPLIVLLHNENQVFDYVQDVPDIAFELMELSERPLTIVFEKGKNVAPQVLGEDGSIGIRICKERPCLDLLRKWNKGLVSTSVNISGEPNANSIEEMNPQLIDNVDGIFKADHIIENTKASQIMKVNSDGSFKILRK